MLKVIAGLIPLGLVLPAPVALRRRLRIGAWFGGVGMVIYGVGQYLAIALAAVGVIPWPRSVGRTALIGHLALWNPFWTLGGVLFVLTAWWSAD